MPSKPLPIDILSAWQRIEFFHPYSPDIDSKKKLSISLKALKENNNQLPWLCDTYREQYKIPKTAAFILYLGEFEKNLSSSLIQNIVGSETGQAKEECEQRLSNEGVTYFATLTIDNNGVPNIQSFSVSALPWALSHLQEKNEAELYSANFAASCEQLISQVTTLLSSLQDPEHNPSGIMRADDLANLLELLTQWANYPKRHDWSADVTISWSDTSKRKKERTVEKNKEVLEPVEEPEEEEEEEEEGKIATLPILNSFFFTDLETVIADLKQQSLSSTSALQRYLSLNNDGTHDLYTPTGLVKITEQLHPKYMPLGRWPSNPQHTMSLMQQFAINTAVKELANGGLLSVNGPPGTGKTTLLRDLIAHNIVERAQKIADYATVDDTLTEQGFIIPALTGYEMVIASSNNAAVENISKELPQKSALGEAFSSLDYLAPVANQVAAKYRPKKQNKTQVNSAKPPLYYPLEQKKQCWGLISVALGKKANRSYFKQRLFFDEHQPSVDNNTPRPDDENFLNLWNWFKSYQGDSFAIAKKKFNRCLQETKALQQELHDLAELLTQCSNDKLSAFENLFSKAQQKISKKTHRLKRLQYKQKLLEIRQNDIHARIDELEQQRQQLENKRFQRLFRFLNKKAFSDNEQALNNWQQYAGKYNKKQQETNSLILEHKNKLEKTQQRVQEYQQKIHFINHHKSELQERYPEMTLPTEDKNIYDADLQRTAFWQNEKINTQRSKLFIAAMELHQAWLYEAFHNNSFKRNFIGGLATFLDNPQKLPSILPRWQTLAMIVPVISTTFAAVSRMFDGVGREAFGWLMIDEAGQASPQQAIGAIWRAKRVLVVGDPLQIEPVFTASPTLVNHLCQEALHQYADSWNPQTFSIQQIADRVNAWGCQLEVMNNPIWIGIPLWVHRRCIEPMFSLANNMAYNGRMIHADAKEKICSRSISEQLKNHWVVSKGNMGNKQYRDSHGKDLLTLVSRLIQEKITLQSIYVITPFKAVKTALIELLKETDLSAIQQPAIKITQKEINYWVKHNIGTVHTFQGKENDIVIFVLGCSIGEEGGAQWAASKPNLLNVALTRAKKYIFVIGDPDVWGHLPSFSDVANTLPKEIGTLE